MVCFLIILATTRAIEGVRFRVSLGGAGGLLLAASDAERLSLKFLSRNDAVSDFWLSCSLNGHAICAIEGIRFQISLGEAGGLSLAASDAECLLLKFLLENNVLPPVDDGLPSGYLAHLAAMLRMPSKASDFGFLLVRRGPCSFPLPMLRVYR